MSNTLEVVTFSLRPGTEESRFAAAALEAGTVLKSMPGFVSRRLSKDEEGSWADIVEWTDMESARRAAELFHTIPTAQLFCSMIEMSTAKIAHHRIVSLA